MRRRSIRAFIFFLMLGILLFGGGATPSIESFPAAVSPLLGTSAAIVSFFKGLYGIGIGTIIALVLAAICVFRPRFFCRNVCPMGVLQDLLSFFRTKIPWPAHRFGGRFQAIGFIFLATAILSLVLPIPSFLWLDPPALFSVMVRQPTSPPALFGWGILGLFFVLPMFWCFNLCPLGALQTILYFPKKRLRRKETASSNEESANAGPIPRRTVLEGIVAMAGVLAFGKFSHANSKSVRPPGSLSERFFSVLCVRCGNCSASCPTKLLRPQNPGSLPQAVFDPAWCETDCTACTKSCPSGAIQALSPEEKKQFKIGLARLEFAHCLLADDRECRICVRDCPYEAIELVWSEAEYLSIPTISPERCNGCGRCVVACPSKPKSLVVDPL